MEMVEILLEKSKQAGPVKVAPLLLETLEQKYEEMESGSTP